MAKKDIVMLCPPEGVKRFVKENGGLKRVAWSVKENGYRCLTIEDGSETIYMSRNDKPFPNFGCFDQVIRHMTAVVKARLLPDHLAGAPVSFDGEMISDDGANTFKGMQEQVFRKSGVDASRFRFKVFDLKLPELVFVERQKILRKLFTEFVPNAPKARVELLPHGLRDFASEDELDAFAKRFFDQGLEGIVIKTLHGAYIPGKAHGHWAKLKKFEFEDMPVLRVIEGEGKLAGGVGVFVCRSPEGTEVNVGPGAATHEELRAFLANPPKVIEVKSYERTEAGSRKHPGYKRARPDLE